MFIFSIFLICFVSGKCDRIRLGDGNMKVLITGASSGIGRDMARAFAKRGYDLVLVARSKERLLHVQEELNQQVKVEIAVCDVSKTENCIQLHQQYPSIDILVNNAGFGDCGEFTQTDLQKELDMIDTNIRAYHILTKLYLQDMVAKNHGKILNVASIAGFMPGPLMATYYATKSYVVRLSEAIRQELYQARSKVQISILCPGPVDTHFNVTANVLFKIREANSQEIAEYAVKKLLKGKFYIVPKIEIKIAKFGAKILPDTCLSQINYNVQKRKIYRPE